MAYHPERSINSIEDLEENNVTLFAHYLLRRTLHEAKYNLSTRLRSQIKVTSELPWDSVNNGESFIISMSTNYFFLKSALNRNLKGDEKYYLLDHIITTNPMLNIFPKYSPYQGEFSATYSRIFEAGLDHYWLTKTLTQSVWSVWRSTHTSMFTLNPYHNNLRRLQFLFRFIIGGWFISFVIFVLELVINRLTKNNFKSVKLRQLYKKCRNRKLRVIVKLGKRIKKESRYICSPKRCRNF